MALDQQPLGFFVPGLTRVRIAPAGPHHRVPASQFEAEHLDIELACAHSAGHVVRRIGDAVHTAVPHDHLAGAIVALGDDAFEIAVLDRMILDHHGKPFVRGIERRSLGYCPRTEDTLHLETEIVMEPGGRMLLHDKHPAAPPSRPG